MSWNSLVNLSMGNWTRPIPLTNSFGILVPPGGQKLPELFNIQPHERVLDLGGGSQPLPRADVVVEPNLDDGVHRGGRAASVDARTMQARAESLPFDDKSFDFVHCRQVLEHVDDPLAACREIMRVGRRGFLETPRKGYDVLFGPNPSHQWFVSSVDGALVFERRPFVCHPFGHPGLGPLPSSPEGQVAIHWEFANVVNTQFYWEEGFDVEVHDDPQGFRYTNDLHAGLAHLDSALCGLLQPGSPPEHRLADAQAACARMPGSAHAHAVRAIWLAQAGRPQESSLAVDQVRALAGQDFVDRWLLAMQQGDFSLLRPEPLEMDRLYWQRHSGPAGVNLQAMAANPARREAPRFARSPRLSRFARQDDPSLQSLVFPLPAPWWSRGHEYAWAMEFAAPGTVVLDAACGISHPLKFALTGPCAEVHACDMDTRLLDFEAIRADVQADFGPQAAAALPRELVESINRVCCSITDMPYPDGAFDTVFCISVLEHMPPADRAGALREFARVTRRGGLVVVTMDHPLVSLQEFIEQAMQAGLRFADDFSVHLPPDALHSKEYGLHCYRALLTHV